MAAWIKSNMDTYTINSADLKGAWRCMYQIVFHVYGTCNSWRAYNQKQVSQSAQQTNPETGSEPSDTEGSHNTYRKLDSKLQQHLTNNSR